MSPLYTLSLSLLCTLALLSGCFAHEVDPAYRALAEKQIDIPSDGVEPGDKIDIQVAHEKELSRTFIVAVDGTINFPYIGRINVKDKTCAQIEKEVIKGLKTGYLSEPIVSCTVSEYNSKRVFILGSVQKPGPYAYRAQSTIIEVIAQAGGFRPGADHNRVRLSRQFKNGKSVQVEVPVKDIIDGLEKNLKMLPGDIIFVPTNAAGLGAGS